MKKKIKINTSVNVELLLEFEDVFPGEQPLKPEEYLIGGSREIILKVAAFFLGFKPQSSKFSDSRELMETIFGPENYEFANEVYDKIKAIERTGQRIKVINNASFALIPLIY